MAKTTIQLNDKTKSDLEDLKRVDGESFDSVVKLLIANYNNDTETSGIDETEIARKIVDAMEQSKGVKIDNVEVVDGKSMDRADVENIVEGWVKNNWDRLRRGELR